VVRNKGGLKEMKNKNLNEKTAQKLYLDIGNTQKLEMNKAESLLAPPFYRKNHKVFLFLVFLSEF
jgi:hypothetical protein